MSLEASIEKLILAIQENTAALQGRVQTTLPLSESEQADLAEAKKLDAEITEKTKRTRRTKAEIATAVTPSVAETPATPPPPPTPEPAMPAEVTIDQIREIAHALIDARRAKNLNPPNGPLVEINKENGWAKISEAAGTPKANEVFLKLQALLKEAS